MAVATPKTFRSQNTLIVTLPGDIEFQCRRPDPLELIAQDILPLPIYAAVFEAVGQGSLSADKMRDAPTTYLNFVDRWVCAAVVEPRVVLDVVDPEQEIHIDELSLESRLLIFSKTSDRLVSSRLAAKVAEFRRQEPPDSGPGPSSAPVQHAAVDAARDSELVVRA